MRPTFLKLYRAGAGAYDDRNAPVEPGLLKRMVLLVYERLVGPHPRPGSSDGETIAKFDGFDVQLVQSSSNSMLVQEPPFWIKFHSTASASVIECYGFHKLDKDELARIIDLIATNAAAIQPLLTEAYPLLYPLSSTLAIYAG